MTISSIGSTTNTQPNFSANGFSQVFNDFKGIASDIQAGNLTDAQSALTTFENDLQSNNGQNPLSQLFSNNSTLSSDLQNLQTALQSNDPTGAQNAFKTLVQDMQGAMKTQMAARHSHHHHRVDNDGDSDDQASGSIQTASGGDTDGDSTIGSTTVGNMLNAQA